MTTPMIRETMKWMAEADLDPVQFNWFDISGTIQDSTHVNVDPLMTYRPPFDQCFVVWRGPTKSHDQYETLMIVKGQDPLEGIVVTAWKGAAGHMPMAIPPMVYLVDGDLLRWGPVDDDQPIDKELAEVVLGMLGAWYSALDNRTNAYLPSVRDTFTNRRKIAAGKLPSYEWRTVVIEPKQARRESLGGTHASPRLHDRRGHLRRLRNGKNVWVKACKVGKAELGAVFHDYEVVA